MRGFEICQQVQQIDIFLFLYYLKTCFVKLLSVSFKDGAPVRGWSDTPRGPDAEAEDEGGGQASKVLRDIQEVRNHSHYGILQYYVMCREFRYDGFKNKHIKLKSPQQLQEILDVSRELLEQLNSGSSESELIEEKKSKLEQIKMVLEMYGHFSGINRKVQLKYQPKGRPRNSSSDEGTFTLLTFFMLHIPCSILL